MKTQNTGDVSLIIPC